MAALLPVLLVCACGREPARKPAPEPPPVVVFQPTLDAAERVARQHYDGDLVVFVCDGSLLCARTRGKVFGPTELGRFIAANFAATEVTAGSSAAQEALTRFHSPAHQPQIIFVSDRLKNLRIYTLRLDRIKEPRLLKQLQGLKQAKTIEEYRRITGQRSPPPPPATRPSPS